MISLSRENVLLRALEPEDIEELISWENDEQNWEVSNTLAPYSRYSLEQYILDASQDLYSIKQLRLVICYKTIPVGFIDLFDFDPKNYKAGIGILIGNKSFRRKGIATKALGIFKDYCSSHLNLHQVYCNILESNLSSINLFEKAGFKCCGLKKDWQFNNGKYHNEGMYQFIFGKISAKNSPKTEDGSRK